MLRIEVDQVPDGARRRYNVRSGRIVKAWVEAKDEDGRLYWREIDLALELDVYVPLVQHLMQRLNLTTNQKRKRP